MLKGFRIYDFSGNAAGSYDPTIGRLIPSSVRHTRLVVSLGRSDFFVGGDVVRKSFRNFNRQRRIPWA
jgi:hypothetical protein